MDKEGRQNFRRGDIKLGFVGGVRVYNTEETKQWGKWGPNVNIHREQRVIF